jgi:glycosyltransferase involved in cell wall biosynthesis
VVSPSRKDLDTCRILYVVGQLGLGGLERQLFYLLQTIDRKRYSPVVVVWNYNDKDLYIREIMSLGVPILGVGNHLSRIGKMVAFRRIVSQLQPEVVHSYSFHTNFAAWWATRGSTALPLGSIRNNFISERRLAGKILGRLSACWPRTQICNSEAAEAVVQKCVGPFKPTRLHVIRNRLDVNRFVVAPSQPNAQMLLAVGRLYPEKRWDRLIRVLALVKKSGLRFLIRHVGAGPLLEELESQAKLLEVDALIQFLGSREDISALLAESSFLVHTADEEGCPNVVMEAMACGRAVLATDSGDVPLLVDNGKTGFVVKREDDKAFADRLVQLITNPDLCAAMGKNGRIKAEQEFDVRCLVKETLDAYRTAGWRDE